MKTTMKTPDSPTVVIFTARRFNRMARSEDVSEAPSANSRSVALLLVFGLLLGTPADGGAQQPPANPPLPRYVEGELLVKFRGGPRGAR